MVDEDYLLVASHVDSLTYSKIIASEYVDFAKLIPRDRVLQEDDGNRLELVIKNGKTFWAPANDTNTAISSFSRWEQAFRVYSDIYSRRYPERSTELNQYNHTIHTASLTFVWNNVYAYDKDFRLHFSRHLTRSC